MLIAAAAVLSGCEVDSFFDPSVTGRFMSTPTTIPILERIDAIEDEVDPWGETTGVLPEDLLPNDLIYVLAPGDFITVEIFEGFAPDQWRVHSRQIDAAGRFRIPDLGDLPAAGLTTQEFEDLVTERMAELVVSPRVNVIVEQGVAFTYTVDGFVAAPNLYSLRKADLRLTEAMTLAGGIVRTAETVYVIRRVPLTEEVLPFFDRERDPDRRPEPRRDVPPVDIEQLIEELDRDGRPSPGMLRPDNRVPIDVDDLEPVRLRHRPEIDVEDIAARQDRRSAGSDESFIFVEETGEWVRARRPQPVDVDDPTRPPHEEPPLMIERIIRIPADRLRRGDSRYDIVVRPNDRIYVEGPETGIVYISGQISRPGVYEMPQTGDRLTLSRLVAAAGDPGPIAIPERVDLIRMVGPNREATIRLDLAAIRRRTEPDLYIKPNDHIIIGTSWLATPLAVIRNGFRATYGFGFLLDRNFGNDVFGAPPSRIVQ